jgi:hypothetical protein
MVFSDSCAKPYQAIGEARRATSVIYSLTALYFLRFVHRQSPRSDFGGKTKMVSRKRMSAVIQSA